MPEPEEEEMLILLRLDIQSCDIPGLNIRIPDKPLSSCILDIDSRSIHSDLEQTLTYVTGSQETDSTGMKRNFKLEQKDFITYIKKTIYWQRMEMFGSMLRFLTIMCCCHRKFICAALLTMEEIPCV